MVVGSSRAACPRSCTSCLWGLHSWTLSGMCSTTPAALPGAWLRSERPISPGMPSHACQAFLNQTNTSAPAPGPPQAPFLRTSVPFLPAKRGDLRVRVPGAPHEEDCSGSSLFAPELNLADLTADGGQGLLDQYEMASRGGLPCWLLPLFNGMACTPPACQLPTAQSQQQQQGSSRRRRCLLSSTTQDMTFTAVVAGLSHWDPRQRAHPPPHPPNPPCHFPAAARAAGPACG